MQTIQPQGYVYEWSPTLMVELMQDARDKADQTKDDYYMSPDLLIRGEGITGTQDRVVFEAINDLSDDLARDEDLITIGPDDTRPELVRVTIEVGGDR